MLVRKSGNLFLVTCSFALQRHRLIPLSFMSKVAGECQYGLSNVTEGVEFNVRGNDDRWLRLHILCDVRIRHNS